MSREKLYGTKTKKWKKIFSQFDAIFVLKTGSGDELNWIRKVVLDHEIAVNIVEIDLLAQVFLNNIRDKGC